MRATVLVLSLLGTFWLINAAPRYTSMGRDLNCGIRLPRLPNLKARSRVQFRVGNGFTPHRSVWPWMVSMRFGEGMSWSHGCGGSLITPRYVLTAAHCVKSIETTPSQLRLRFGEYEVRTREPGEFDSAVKKIIVHRDYVDSRGGSYHDIALLQLDKGVPLNEYTNVVCLPRANRRSLGDQTFTITGWGRMTDNSLADVLQQVEVPGMNDTTCSQGWSSILPSGIRGQFCTAVVNQRDSCKGDSGGPVMLYEEGRWVQYGVVSAGSSLCGSDILPSLNVDVANYIDWIRNAIATEERQ